ncbi:uncharacterized protein LOC115757851 [Drosophila novamexicana]|uniref:uncharacterized protein LOC115757851 n=1 Tax=Drosophila novamexicana TaxID=47314 RepID=UPI0011E5FDCB|nr:uncharacterized protein LOC115757851 [Drosophila novamexicana]
MEIDDLSAILSLFEHNVNKLRTNLSAYQVEVDAVRQTLQESWSHVGRADGRIISVHDALLGSVNEVNEYIIKLNLRIKLNGAFGIFKNVDAKEVLNNLRRKSLEHNNYKVNHTNLDGIEVGELDVHSVGAKQSETEFKARKGLSRTAPFVRLATAQEHAKLESPSIPAAPTAPPKLPIPPRQAKLLPPNGGRQMTSNETYDQLLKNISSFAEDSIVQVTMMHLNIAENCIFVAKWGLESTPLKKLLACQMPIQELNQLPDFGEIFAVYDAQEQIIPRVVINAHTEGGGYDAYLLDYGEHIHLDDEEVIFALPNEVKMLPAEAVRCFVRNREVGSMRRFTYKNVRVRVLENSGNDLVVDLMEDGHPEEKTQSSNRFASLENTRKINLGIDLEEQAKPKETNIVKETQSAKTEQQLAEPTLKLCPADLEMLENIECGTSDALKAVLGFKPTDDQRICRHYDPKIKGCFKGTNCRLLHQPFAPHGATKDTELVEALPDSIYVSPAPRDLGSVVRVLVTYIKSPTQVYVQFVDDLPPLVWSKKEVPESQCKFKRSPHVLDLVMALYTDDCYYRAQIIDEIDGVFKIFYVDYGNTEFVTIKSLAPCSDAISLKPYRANNCLIEGVKRSSLASQQQNAECVEFLKSIILNSEFDVMLISHMPDNGYVIKFLDRYADVPKQMIKRGYVEPTTDNLQHSDNSVEQA